MLKAWRCPQRLSLYSSMAASLVHEESAFLSFWALLPYSSVPGSKVTPVQGNHKVYSLPLPGLGG